MICSHRSLEIESLGSTLQHEWFKACHRGPLFIYCQPVRMANCKSHSCIRDNNIVTITSLSFVWQIQVLKIDFNTFKTYSSYSVLFTFLGFFVWLPFLSNVWKLIMIFTSAQHTLSIKHEQIRQGKICLSDEFLCLRFIVVVEIIKVL